MKTVPIESLNIPDKYKKTNVINRPSVLFIYEFILKKSVKHCDISFRVNIEIYVSKNPLPLGLGVSEKIFRLFIDFCVWLCYNKCIAGRITIT